MGDEAWPTLCDIQLNVCGQAGKVSKKNSNMQERYTKSSSMQPVFTSSGQTDLFSTEVPQVYLHSGFEEAQPVR